MLKNRRFLISFCVFLLIIAPIMAVPPNIPTNGLVAYYSFDDGTAMDNSGNGYSGTIQGASVTSGIREMALHYDGTNDIVDIPYLFQTNPQQITFIAFIKPSVIKGDELRVMQFGNPEFAMVFNTSGILRSGVHLSDGSEWGQWYWAQNTTQIPLFEWTQCVGVIDKNANTVKIYVNGQLNQEISLPNYPYFIYPGVYNTLGACHQSWAGYTGLYTGDIDEVLIYNRALTPTEVSTIYNSYYTTSNFELPLYSGWNFISTPKTLAAGHNTATIFSQVDMGGHSAYMWDGSQSPGHWNTLQANTPILPLYGVWIYSTSSKVVNLQFDNNPMSTPPQRSLPAGWNTIGFTGLTPISARNTYLAVQSSWVNSMGFNGLIQSYEQTIFNGDPSESTLLYPTKGYWLFMREPGILPAIGASPTPTVTPPESGNVATIAYTIYDDQNRPIVTTNSKIYNDTLAKGGTIFYSNPLMIPVNVATNTNVTRIPVIYQQYQTYFGLFRDEMNQISTGLSGMKVNEQKRISLVLPNDPLETLISADQFALLVKPISETYVNEQIVLALSDNPEINLGNTNPDNQYMRTFYVKGISSNGIDMKYGYSTVDVQVIGLKTQ
jgi:hypothetical protein